MLSARPLFTTGGPEDGARRLSVERGATWIVAWVAAHAVLVVAAIFAADAACFGLHVPLAVLGVADEPAHVATAALLLAVLARRAGGRFAASALAASVLIDLDHIPLYLGWIHIGEAGRPWTHSLASVAAALAVAGVWRAPTRAYALGVAFGLGAHFARDVATGYLPLFWPVWGAGVTMPYAPYAAVLVACGVVLWRREGGGWRRS